MAEAKKLEKLMAKMKDREENCSICKTISWAKVVARTLRICSDLCISSRKTFKVLLNKAHSHKAAARSAGTRHTHANTHVFCVHVCVRMIGRLGAWP